MIRVTLPSDGSHDFYPQNTLSNFTIKLARTLEFNGEYECALSEIIFPNRLVNVREGHNMVDIHRFTKKWTNSLKMRFKIPAGSYDSVSKVVAAVENIIGKSKYGGTGSRGRRVNAFTISYNSTTKRVTVTTKFNYAVHFGSDICYLLGFEVGKLNAKGFDSIDGTRTGEYYASKTGGLNTLYIYTDIIKEQIVGGIHSPLLRVINLGQKENNEESTSMTMDRLFYCAMKRTNIDNINIQLRDDMGHLVHFEFGKVVVVLEFRPKV